MLPSIGVPTTAGTGSEAQSYALIADEKTHLKMACGDRKAAFRVAILDPEVTVSQPAGHGLTGIDAVVARPRIVRAPRSATRCRRCSPARPGGCWKPTWKRCCDDPTTSKPRGAMQLGAYFAGTAIENSMLGAATPGQSADRPLRHHPRPGDRHPAAARDPLQRPAAGPLYGELVRRGWPDNGDRRAAAEAIGRTGQRLDAYGRLPTTLADVRRQSRHLLPVLAEEANSNGPAVQSAAGDGSEILELYEAAL